MVNERKPVYVGKSNAALIANPHADLSDWDDEELEQGRRRDKNGNFSGRPPKVVPRAVAAEYFYRQTQRAELKLAGSAEVFAKRLADLASDASVDPKVRLQAITWGLEKLLGKAPASVQVSADVRHRSAPWEQVLQDAIVVVGTEADEDVIDDEVVDDPEIAWDEE